MKSCVTSRTNTPNEARSAAAEDSPKTPKKAFTAGAWEEARGLIWTHRKRLALGLGLMLINRLAGLVLPTTTKYLMDDVIAQGHWDLLPTLAMAAGAATLVDAVDRVRHLAGARRRRAARDHRHAQGRRSARDAPADPLLRFDQDRRPDLADHDRRRRHPESGRHRPGAADRLDRDRGDRARRPALSELAAHAGHASSSSARSAAAWPRRSSGCGRCSASAARSTPK